MPATALRVDHSDLRRQLGFFMREYLQIFDHDDRAILERSVIASVCAAHDHITDGVRNAERRRARRLNLRCYICDRLLDFDSETSKERFTLDHVWPHSYGGESIEDNLLAACDACNSDLKGNLATWVMAAVQSVVLGCRPPPRAIASVNPELRYALLHFAAWRFAGDRHLSLKDAFRQIGPWTAIRIKDAEGDCDFFNILNHQEVPDFSWE
jgi:hypothetical protein